MKRKLTSKTKPRKLTLGQMWELYRTDTGEETPELLISVLDTVYSGHERNNMAVSFVKAKEFMGIYNEFKTLVQGLVKDG